MFVSLPSPKSDEETSEPKRFWDASSEITKRSLRSSYPDHPDDRSYSSTSTSQRQSTSKIVTKTGEVVSSPRGRRRSLLGRILGSKKSEYKDDEKVPGPPSEDPYIIRLHKQAVGGNMQSMFALAYALDTGMKKRVKAMPEQAVYWYERAAGLGHAEAMNNLGAMYTRAEFGENWADALVWYEKAAAAGSPAGMFNFGMALIQGRGFIKKDEKRGHEYLEKAAKKGVSEAICNFVAVLAKNKSSIGSSSPQLVKAVKMLDKLVTDQKEAAGPEAMFNLGLCLFYGIGIKTDEARAFSLFDQLLSFEDFYLKESEIKSCRENCTFLLCE